MTDRAGKKREGRYDNWLTAFDEAAQSLEPAQTFLDCSGLHLIRHPQLQPIPPEDTYALRIFESNQKSFLHQIAMKQALFPPRATKGLTPAQSDQLAALVIDLEGDSEHFLRYGKDAAELRQILRGGETKQRKLTQQVKNARAALSRLRDLAAKVPPVLGGPYRAAAERCLKDLDGLFEPIPNQMWRERTQVQSVDDRTSFAVVPLYWFFRHECQLSGNESEVRAAMIRNQFLTPEGKPPLKYKPQYSDAETQGCTAVRQAVKRFRLSGGTSR
jgi:hypothetical protein